MNVILSTLPCLMSRLKILSVFLLFFFGESTSLPKFLSASGEVSFSF